MTFFIPFTCVTLYQLYSRCDHLLCVIKNIKNMTVSEYHVISKEVEKLLQTQSHIYTVYTTHIDKVVGL